MKFTAKLFTPRLNLEGYKKALHQYMLEAISRGISIWLDTVLMEIPTWSGASRATFAKLAQTISYNIPNAPTVANRIGEGVGSSAGSLESDKGRYVFHYSTTLPWLIWNEYNNANVNPDPSLFYRVIKEGPYNFQLKGALVFTRFASTVVLPPVAPSIKSVRVKV